MDTFMIEGKAYHLYNLRTNERLITLKKTEEHNPEKYYVLHVEGDSMNDKGIESGSYVLVRQQNTADENDIVAAISIEGKITRATLKLCVKKNSTIELHPKSKNPKHKPILVDKSQEATYIRGVALGVFKLAPEQP